MLDPNELLTAPEAAKLAGVSATAIYQAIADGRIRTARSRDPVLIDAAEIERYVGARVLAARKPEKGGES